MTNIPLGFGPVTQSAAEITEFTARSYGHMFRERVRKTPNKVAFRYPENTEPETWTPLTWAQTRVKVDEFAAALLALSLKPGDRVALACSTRIEWVLLDLAVACAAGVTTTVYPSTQAGDEQFILADSGAAILIAENWEQVEKVQGSEVLDQQIKHIILIDDEFRPFGFTDPRVSLYRDLAALGRTWLTTHPKAVEETLALANRDSLSTLIYTSGTTGTPKGVEITHGSWTYEGATVAMRNFVFADDVLYLWLPLAHVFGRDLLSVQLQIGFESIVDGRVNRIVAGVGETHPTILVGVPRIFEKVRATVMTMYPKRGLKGRISRWAFAVGRDSRSYRLAGDKMPFGLRVRYALADALVYKKLKHKLGGRMRLMISGSAKLSAQVQEWFYSAGLTLIEGYGLTETSAIACVDDPSHPHFGTVGLPLPGMETRIADDGEILLQGPIVARGYRGLPEANAEAFTDGWFHTGDIGEFTTDGCVRITDRKKDLLKTSNGKYVAPQKVETAIMANTPYAAQAVVIGEGHQYVSALIVLDQDSLETWARNHGQAHATFAEISQLSEIRRSIDRCIRRANRKLERWETIKKYVILTRELTLEQGELTPSLKVRRAAVMRNFAAQLDSIYAPNSPVPFVPESTSKKRR
ncbi:MAG: long-chain fatty acid--CoA ligase [Propionibacteriaceae bacterium]|jgi:long-chain acyl-CoA synthetase|nr:long-chain fatty acid--CoA ligase [Propionibacteriaceae bacterium]